MRERSAWDEFWWPPAFLGLGEITKVEVYVWRTLVAGFLISCALQAMALFWRADAARACRPEAAACVAAAQADARGDDQGL